MFNLPSYSFVMHMPLRNLFFPVQPAAKNLLTECLYLTQGQGVDFALSEGVNLKNNNCYYFVMKHTISIC